MKSIIIYLMLLVFISCKSQVGEKLTFDRLKIELINFLQSKQEVDKLRVEKLKNGENILNLSGLFNSKFDGELKNGIYSFSVFSSHSRGYFVIVENESFIILDLSTREYLDDSIKNVLNFSERSEYCVGITREIISRLITVYYNKNKNTLAGFDLNCEKGIINTDDLP